MQNTNLHAYIIASPDANLSLEKAETLAAAILCESPANGNACNTCKHCKKVSARIHPDIIYIRRNTDSSGKERRDLVVDQMRAMIADAQIMPNEAEKKVYIIPDGDRMNLNAQNSVLKLLEEPPKTAAFIICAQNPESLLPTVRSRCAMLRINAENTADNGESSSLAHEFISLAMKSDQANLMRFFAANEKLDTQGCKDFIGSLVTMSAEKLTNGEAEDRKRMMSIIDRAKRAQKYMKFNVSVKHALGMLCVSNYK